MFFRVAWKRWVVVRLVIARLSHASERRSALTGRRRAGLASGDLLLEPRIGFADERRVEMESAIVLRCGLLTRGERRFRADVPGL